MSQINFFMTEKDENEFVKMLFDRDDTLIIKGRFYITKSPKPVKKLNKFGKKEEYYLINTQITPKPYCSARGMGKYFGEYLFDSFKDANIEFSRCYYHNKVLVSGRIFCKLGHLKSAEHNKIYKSWYNFLERWIKERYKKFQDPWWIGPDAEKWSKKGGKLALGDPLADIISLKK